MKFITNLLGKKPNNNEKSTSNDEITKFFSWISGQIQKNNILFLKELYKNQKTFGLKFRENEALFAIIELNIIGYIYHDFALFTSDLHEYRAKFNSEFYEDNKRLFLQMNYDFTTDNFNCLIDEIGVLLRNEDISTLSSRILFTLRNNTPVGKHEMLLSTNGLQNALLEPFIIEHTIECMKHAKRFVNSIQQEHKNNKD